MSRNPRNTGIINFNSSRNKLKSDKNKRLLLPGQINTSKRLKKASTPTPRPSVHSSNMSDSDWSDGSDGSENTYGSSSSSNPFNSSSRSKSSSITDSFHDSIDYGNPDQIDPEIFYNAPMADLDEEYDNNDRGMTNPHMSKRDKAANNYLNAIYNDKFTRMDVDTARRIYDELNLDPKTGGVRLVGPVGHDWVDGEFEATSKPYYFMMTDNGYIVGDRKKDKFKKVYGVRYMEGIDDVVAIGADGQPIYLGKKLAVIGDNFTIPGHPLEILHKFKQNRHIVSDDDNDNEYDEHNYDKPEWVVRKDSVMNTHPNRILMDPKDYDRMFSWRDGKHKHLDFPDVHVYNYKNPEIYGADHNKYALDVHGNIMYVDKKPVRLSLKEIKNLEKRFVSNNKSQKLKDKYERDRNAAAMIVKNERDERDERAKRRKTSRTDRPPVVPLRDIKSQITTRSINRDKNRINAQAAETQLINILTRMELGRETPYDDSMYQSIMNSYRFDADKMNAIKQEVVEKINHIRKSEANKRVWVTNTEPGFTGIRIGTRGTNRHNADTFSRYLADRMERNNNIDRQIKNMTGQFTNMSTSRQHDDLGNLTNQFANMPVSGRRKSSSEGFNFGKHRKSGRSGKNKYRQKRSNKYKHKMSTKRSSRRIKSRK